MIMAKKGYVYPIKKKIPLILLLNLFGNFIIAYFLRKVNKKDKKLKIRWHMYWGIWFFLGVNVFGSPYPQRPVS